MTTSVGSGSASISTSAAASTPSPTPPSPSRNAAEAHPAAPRSTHHARPVAPPISTVPTSPDLHGHGLTGADSAGPGPMTRDNSPMSASSKMPTTDSVPGMGSFASHGTSNYLRTPTTPIMGQCFVDSPADARHSGFPTFQAFTAPPSALKTALHPNSAYTASPSAERDKKRPHPLELDTGKTGSGEYDGPLTSMSTGSARSTLSNELEHLRRSVHQNLRERPIDISVDDSDSELGELDVAQDTADRAIDAPQAFQLLRSSPQLLFVDTRPLDDFLRAHLARAAHVNIPSIIYNRLRRQLTGSHHEDTAATWSSLGSFVSTSSGRSLWDGVDLGSHLDVIVIGTSSANGDPSQKLATVLTHLVNHGSVRVLKGGWGEAAPLAESEGLVVVSGESKEGVRTDLTPVALGPTAAPAAPGSGASTPSALALSPPDAPPVTLEQGGAPAPSQIASRENSSSSSGSSTSGPSMSPMRRSLPQLSLNVGSASVQQPQVAQPMTESQLRRPPKLSLQVDPSNTLPLPIQRKALSARTRPKPGGLTIDVGDSNRLHVPGGLRSAMPSRSGHSGLTPDRRYSGSTSAGFVSRPDEPWSRNDRHGAPPSPLHLPAGEPYSTATTFSSAGVTPVGKPIEVSTILPSFLYLGPEIATRADVDTLLALGIRRILNVAVECDDDEGLGLRTSFERYYRIPMKDAVEESGVSKGIRDSCNILDDARLHDAPVYVHCKAGKSRSVTVVLAYLIHANAWTLKTSYAYVAERRHGISPNIGFVAELIQFEETELGNKQKEDSEEGDRGPQIPAVVPHPKPGLRYTRESLPPQWGSDTPSASAPASALGGPIVSEPEHTPENTATRRQKQSAADIEVRKNGQWVHGRRAPVDRTTLQPGRRVSKAGLESMTMRPLEPAVSRSPEP